MEHCGFDVVAVVVSVPDVMTVVRRTQPHAVVLDLALSGQLGVNVVPELAATAPGLAVVVLSPFSALEPDAFDVGACDVLDKSDLRRLARCLQSVAHRCLAGGAATA